MQAANAARGAPAEGGGIEPGAVFTVDPSLVHLPTAINGPHRDQRWVLVVSCKGDCHQNYLPTVLVVVLSAQVQNFWASHDVLLRKGDGGTDRDCIAEGDTIFPILKADLRTGALRGTVFTSSLGQIRVRIGSVIGLAAHDPINPK